MWLSENSWSNEAHVRMGCHYFSRYTDVSEHVTARPIYYFHCGPIVAAECELAVDESKTSCVCVCVCNCCFPCKQSKPCFEMPVLGEFGSSGGRAQI